MQYSLQLNSGIDRIVDSALLVQVSVQYISLLSYNSITKVSLSYLSQV